MEKKGMRVLVCGGRAYDDIERINAVLDGLHEKRPIGLVIHGRATGADTLGGVWATLRGMPVCTFEPNWKAHGKAAGLIRNGWMLEWGMPDLVVAFPGGTGTRDMVRQARSAGVEVVPVAE